MYLTFSPNGGVAGFANEAAPSTADCCSRSAQILSNAETLSQKPKQAGHSSNVCPPSDLICISPLQRGHVFSVFVTSGVVAAAAPQRAQCLLPMNIIAKHDGQATVAKRASQKRHCGASLATEAPHIGQLRVVASMTRILQDRVDTMTGFTEKDC